MDERGSTQIAECDQNWSMVLPPVDHDCSLKDFVTELANRIAKLEHENAQLKKSLYGARSERSKMPRVKTGAPATPEQKTATRQARAEAKAQTPTLRVDHKVPDRIRPSTSRQGERLTASPHAILLGVCRRSSFRPSLSSLTPMGSSASSGRA